jgi:hypothetical protein
MMDGATTALDKRRPVRHRDGRSVHNRNAVRLLPAMAEGCADAEAREAGGCADA